MSLCPGFRTNQLKVQVTSTGKLRISGERKLGSGKWLRFQKEVEVPADADTDKISAKLEDGVLYLRQPKKPTATSNIPPEKPKPKAETLPPAAAAKPKAETLPPTAAAKPKAETLPPAEAPKPPAVKPTADPPTVRQNASKSRNDRPKPQAIGKQPTPPPKVQELPKPREVAGAPAMTQNSAEKPQPVQEAALKSSTDQKQTDGKPKAHPKLKDALEEKEGVGSKMAEEVKEAIVSKMGEKEGGVAEERRRKKRRGEMVEEGRSFRGEGFKLKEVRRTTMAAVVLGVVAFVIFYLNVTKKGNVEGEL